MEAKLLILCERSVEHRAEFKANKDLEFGSLVKQAKNNKFILRDYPASSGFAFLLTLGTPK